MPLHHRQNKCKGCRNKGRTVLLQQQPGVSCHCVNKWWRLTWYQEQGENENRVPCLEWLLGIVLPLPALGGFFLGVCHPCVLKSQGWKLGPLSAIAKTPAIVGKFCEHHWEPCSSFYLPCCHSTPLAFWAVRYCKAQPCHPPGGDVQN